MWLVIRWDCVESGGSSVVLVVVYGYWDGFGGGLLC